jgi:hypothetical protein
MQGILLFLSGSCSKTEVFEQLYLTLSTRFSTVLKSRNGRLFSQRPQAAHLSQSAFIRFEITGQS